MTQDTKPLNGKPTYSDETLLKVCLEAIGQAEQEASRIEICRCLITIICQGLFCDDKQHLVPVKSETHVGQCELLKQDIYDLRKSTITNIIH